MYPHERSLVKHFEGRPFVLLGVNSDSDREQLRKRIAEEGIHWRSWWDGGDGRIAADWSIGPWPTLYIIDHEGVIRRKFLGSGAKDRLEAILEPMVREAEAEHQQP
jgi:hypothetical protein